MEELKYKRRIIGHIVLSLLVYSSALAVGVPVLLRFVLGSYFFGSVSCSGGYYGHKHGYNKSTANTIARSFELLKTYAALCLFMSVSYAGMYYIGVKASVVTWVFVIEITLAACFVAYWLLVRKPRAGEHQRD